jgi:hypothetical protein
MQPTQTPSFRQCYRSCYAVTRIDRYSSKVYNEHFICPNECSKLSKNFISLFKPYTTFVSGGADEAYDWAEAYRDLYTRNAITLDSFNIKQGSIREIFRGKSDHRNDMKE